MKFCDIVFPVALTAIILISCDPNRVFEKNIRIPDGIWDRNNPVRFEVVVEDTITPQKLYKEQVRFAQKGEYIFEYEQAMRLEKLSFILDVGLRVEKAR